MIFAYIFGILSVLSLAVGLAVIQDSSSDLELQLKLSVWLSSSLFNAFFAFLAWKIVEVSELLTDANLQRKQLLKIQKDQFEFAKVTLVKTKEHVEPIRPISSNQVAEPLQTATPKNFNSFVILDSGKITPKPNGKVTIKTNQGERSFENVASAKKFLVGKDVQ